MARPGISTKNTEKTPLGPKFWNPNKIPQKYRKNTKNTHFGILGIFGVFWESRISGRGVFFRYFSWKFQVGPFRGSVAGRGVLKDRSKVGFLKGQKKHTKFFIKGSGEAIRVANHKAILPA